MGQDLHDERRLVRIRGGELLSVTVAVAALLGGVVLAPAAAASRPAPAAGGRADVRVTFDEGSGGRGSVVRSARSTGTADVRVDVVTRSGGTARRVRGTGSRWAVRLPALQESSDPARAVLRIRATGGGDPLSPGEHGFIFGADFRLRAESVGGPVDNGDNLVQRGLWNDPAQIKLEVDGGTVGCRVKGSAGDVYVRSSVRVQPGQWYRALCRRAGHGLVLRVAAVSASGAGPFTRDRADGDIGVVDMADAVPMSVGGKLSADGSMDLAATDQLNGAVDRVVYRRRS
jgi:hypothetical protein